MVTPDIETSTREERLEFIREEFRCLGNCPICGKCSFLRGCEAEELYADILRISPKHLSKAVRVTTGEKAMQWIEKYTVINAKNLLRTSSLPIAQIADMLSFSNPSDFGKYFRKHAGCPPLAFRKLGK